MLLDAFISSGYAGSLFPIPRFPLLSILIASDSVPQFDGVVKNSRFPSFVLVVSFLAAILANSFPAESESFVSNDMLEMSVVVDVVRAPAICRVASCEDVAEVCRYSSAVPVDVTSSVPSGEIVQIPTLPSFSILTFSSLKYSPI